MSSTAQYRQPDGSLSGSRSDAILVSEADVVASALKFSALPAGYFVGTGVRETGLAENECDTDFYDDGSVKAETYGLYQLNRDDAIYAAKPAAAIDPEGQLTDLDTATEVMAAVAKRNRAAVLAAAGLEETSAPPEAWCYVAWAHNQGLGAALKSIRTYGLDWAALKARDQPSYVTDRLIPYAEAILGYVRKYPQGGAPGAGTATAIRQLVTLFAVLWLGWRLWRAFA